MSTWTRRDFLRWSAAVAALYGLGRAAELDLRKLALVLDDRLLLPDQAGYAGSSHSYNPLFDSKPLAVARCRDAEDVSTVVRFCRETGVPLSLRSGGHSYAGFSVGSGIVLDVGAMNRVFPTEQGVVVEAGACLRTINQELSARGLAIPAGTCPDVGIAGLTLGGGHGFLSRAHGLTIDSLIGLDLVDAEGRLRTVDSREEGDLFWACRGGGGGNFGAVTSFRFRPIPLRQVAMYYVQWPFDVTAEALKIWNEWAPQADERLTSQLTLRPGEAVSRGVFAGPREELDSELQPLRRLGGRVVTQTAPFIDVIEYLGGRGGGATSPFQAKSDYATEKLADKAVQLIARSLAEADKMQVALQFDSYGGRIARVQPTETAFAHRDARFSLQYLVYWSRGSDGKAERSWLRKLYKALRPHLSGGCYCNYPDLELENWEEAYYGKNAGRLKDVKRAVDPSNFFRFAQSIRPR